MAACLPACALQAASAALAAAKKAVAVTEARLAELIEAEKQGLLGTSGEAQQQAQPVPQSYLPVPDVPQSYLPVPEDMPGPCAVIECPHTLARAAGGQGLSC